MAQRTTEWQGRPSSAKRFVFMVTCDERTPNLSTSSFLRQISVNLGSQGCPEKKRTYMGCFLGHPLMIVDIPKSEGYQGLNHAHLAYTNLANHLQQRSYRVVRKHRNFSNPVLDPLPSVPTLCFGWPGMDRQFRCPHASRCSKRRLSMQQYSSHNPPLD